MIEWEIRDVLKLISLYKKCHYLWDCTCLTYSNSNARNRAWFQIAKEMDRSVDDVKRKMKHLRYAYIMERKKLIESLKTASSPADVYCPSLFFYEKMRFLDCVPGNQQKSIEDSTNSNGTPRQDDSVTANETECKQNQLRDCISNNTVIEITNEHCSCGREQNKENNQEEHCSDQTCSQSNIEKEDNLDIATTNKVEDNATENSTICTCFAKSIELQLMQLPIVLSSMAMAEMQQILAYYMGKNFNTQNSNNETEINRESSPRRERK